jgi:hypothetical protein
MLIKKLGLEIRKVGSTPELYRDVDIVLAKHNVPTGGVSAEVQIGTVAHSLHKMLSTKGYFDICTVRSCADLTGLHISSERMDMYRAIHCMSWNDMEPDYRQLVMAMVLDDFRPVLNPQEIDIVEVNIG